MWRFYIRYQSGNVASANATDVDRANWTACNTVYNRLRPEWRTIVTLNYQRHDETSNPLEDYCQSHAMTMATVWTIIRSVQTLAAEERGLISRRPERLRKPEHFYTERRNSSTGKTDPDRNSYTDTRKSSPNQTDPDPTIYTEPCNSSQTVPASTDPDPASYTSNRNFQTDRPGQSDNQKE